jgi:hypothetical protein
VTASQHAVFVIPLEDFEHTVVVIEQSLFGLCRYRRGYFSTLKDVNELAPTLGLSDVLRLYCDSHLNHKYPQLILSQSASTVRVDLTKGVEAVFAGANQLFRRCIRAAEKLQNGIRVATNTPQAKTDFLKLYNSFAVAKGGVPKLSVDGFRPYANLAETSVLYLDDRPMSAVVTIKDPSSKCAINMFTTTRRFESKTDAELCGRLNRYLHWLELGKCFSEGLEAYDLGFLYRDLGHPFNRFKLSFGGRVVSLYCYTFAGAGRFARLAVDAYSWISTSRLAGLVRHF